MHLEAEPRDYGYPRPQLRRAHWQSLDGTWDLALDPEARLARADVAYDRSIVVPYAPETPASGVGETGSFRACWYRRRFTAPPLAGSERLLLHLGAVDHRADVWLDGQHVASHEGGYTPFGADVTEALGAAGEHELVVRAADDPLDLEQPRGKQDWLEQPHAIWYPRTTGIWQTVWLERVPETRIERLRVGGDALRYTVDVELRLTGRLTDGLRLSLRLAHGERVLVEDTYTVTGPELARRLVLPDPGIGDERRRLWWRPSQPTLLDLTFELRDAAGELVDRVESYTALRTVGVDAERFLLNGRPYQLRLVLDQGYWPETGLTPPGDAALRRDVELVKALGFNGVRKHQKIEDPRFLWWADALGLLVWEEQPSAYRFSTRAVERVTRCWLEAVERDRSHPCVVAWVPLNESWGVPDLPTEAAQRHWVQALYHLTRALDPTRVVVGNDGWEAVAAATDLLGVHDYDDDPERLRRRWSGPREAVLRSDQPGGHALTLGEPAPLHVPLALTEFGGLALSSEPGTWGYARAAGSDDLAERYERLLAAVHAVPRLAGFCYTQLTDTYQEANGLLTMAREPKVPLERLARATYGPVEGFAGWREPPPFDP